MTQRQNDSQLRGSLRHQIRLAATQLAEHRQGVNLRRAALGERLRAGLTSPGMLLLAGGTGFIIAEFTGRADSERQSSQPSASRRPLLAGARTALRFALQVYSFAHAVSRAVDAEPYTPHYQTELPSA